MSAEEIDRFQIDVQLDHGLAQRIRDGGLGLGAITTSARGEGYDFTLDELKAYVSAQSSGTLSDEQLASVAAAGSTWTSTITAAWTFVVVVVVATGAVVVT